MALAAAIAGPYGGVWDSIDYGQTQDGFRVMLRAAKELVRSNSYGDSVLDAVYRGGECFITFAGIEYGKLDDVNAGGLNVSILWPYGALGVMGQVGRLDSGSSLVGSSVLTRVSSSTSATPTSLTAAQTMLSEDHNLDLLMATKHRIVPLTLRAYPYTSTGDRWFATA